MWQGGRQKRQGWGGFWPAPCHECNGCARRGCPYATLYVVVQVLAALGGNASMELKYHKTCGKSRREPHPLAPTIDDTDLRSVVARRPRGMHAANNPGAGLSR